MAKIIENSNGRRVIKLSADDVFSVVSEFQEKVSFKVITKEDARKIFEYESIILPEEL